jgi:hypothetical protein
MPRITEPVDAANAADCLHAGRPSPPGESMELSVLNRIRDFLCSPSRSRTGLVSRTSARPLDKARGVREPEIEDVEPRIAA